ncbi:hypothetical protein EMIHUDRAFT_241839 [Emiliania huxleyi CCMP1516]|uniref:Uncharacterized protein n=2 Tax=Emiliania huxleyi TaxID=2903 RepID=A0A0D3JB82_EMIH1|nr:hypothetical protein EMIHUDRAFT_241839 [Emiliania huxleyi CCMP1516]EOD20767.1 hypothetical protein EMIHUDRAFT_241839 [Emiliania huxleyi CCMP1516]|eukprot:XP_005773196.1 hypothetical protein EMIHUDRAFT_241839 [Emiliania huxleyi CCMP1516]
MGCHASRPQEYDDLAGLASAISSGLEEERAETTIPANAEAAPAAALPSATDLGVDDERLAEWRKLGGGDLEPVLTSGAVALLDAQWIIGHAEAGGVLTHRQALPKEAFFSLADLVEATIGFGTFGRLPVAALSYPWLTKDHPDPRGANLARVARALKALLSDSSGNNRLRLGVFWDFGSLHQHPDPANGVERTEEQNALFKQGLGCLGTLYSHPRTWVLRLTSFPDGHKAEDQAEGTNVAKYFDRGWCFTEQCWASLTKSGRLSLDLGKMRDGVEYTWGGLISDCTSNGGRRPPLLPSAFAAELEMKGFTNGKDDKPLVKRLYEAAFEEQFGKATKLHYQRLGWGDAEAAQLAEVLASGAASRLETLQLFDNKIGDDGGKALAAVLGKEGAAPRLEALNLEFNKIGDEGCKALAAALGKEGAAPRLETLDFSFNKIGDEGCKALAAALKEGAAPSLKARDAPLATRPSPAQCPSRLPSRRLSKIANGPSREGDGGARGNNGDATDDANRGTGDDGGGEGDSDVEVDATVSRAPPKRMRTAMEVTEWRANGTIRKGRARRMEKEAASRQRLLAISRHSQRTLATWEGFVKDGLKNIRTKKRRREEPAEDAAGRRYMSRHPPRG